MPSPEGKSVLFGSLDCGWLQSPCAPCHVPSYPWFSQDELRRRFLGHPIYLDPKGKGDNSMSRKAAVGRRRVGPGAARPASYGESYTCPKPNSQGSICPLIGTTSDAGVRSNVGHYGRSMLLLRVGPMINEIMQGNEWTAYGMLGRTMVTEHGMAYSPRGPWSRNAHMSRGGRVPPGRPATPATGQRGIGVCGSAAGR